MTTSSIYAKQKLLWLCLSRVIETASSARVNQLPIPLRPSNHPKTSETRQAFVSTCAEIELLRIPRKRNAIEPKATTGPLPILRATWPRPSVVAETCEGLDRVVRKAANMLVFEKLYWVCIKIGRPPKDPEKGIDSPKLPKTCQPCKGPQFAGKPSQPNRVKDTTNPVPSCVQSHTASCLAPRTIHWPKPRARPLHSR